MEVYEFKKFKEVHKRMEREYKKGQREREKYFRKLRKKYGFELDYKKSKKEQKRQKKHFSNTPVVLTKNESLIIITCIPISIGIISLYFGITIPGDVEMARIFFIIGVILLAIPIALIIYTSSIDDSSSKLNTCKDNINKEELKDNNFQEIKNELNLLESEVKKTVSQNHISDKRIKWNEELFIIELTKTEKGTEVIPVVKEFLEWGKKKNLLKIWWGSGKITGSFYFKFNNVQFLQVNTLLKFSVYIQILKNIAPFNNLDNFEELLNRMKEIFGNLLNNEVRDKGITLPLNTLSEDKLTKFFKILDWILDKIKTKEKEKK